MDSVVGEDQTLPVDINGSCGLSRLPDSLNAGDFSMDNMTAPTFPDKMSPTKILAMKDYENQIAALKKENFNLKLRIYFMEERMQQSCDDSTENLFKTNIELKVEVESMKRDLAEKQELLVAASKALESLAGRDTGDVQRVREQARREMDALQQALNHQISTLQEDLSAAQEEVDKMASLAEQEKLRNIAMEKQLLSLGGPPSGSHGNGPAHTLQQALREKDSVIEQLTLKLQNQEAANNRVGRDLPTTDQLRQLSTLIGQKDQELEVLRQELDRERNRTQTDLQVLTKSQSEVSRLESTNQQLNKELGQTQGANQSLTKTLEEVQRQSKELGAKLEEMEGELSSEKKNSLKRDKTIQGLTLVLKEKEKEIEELCHEIQDRDEALSKAREAAHKAQLQKYQGAEEHQSLLMEKQAELAQLQGDHHAKLLEAQKLQRSLGRREQELGDMQQAKEQLEAELEDLQQQKKRGDKALNDVQNQLKKLSGELAEREWALEQQHREQQEQSRMKLHQNDVTIQRLTTSLADKEQQLQEYMNMARDFETNRSPGGSDVILSKLRERLKEKEKALEEALDERFAALEEKDNEIHQLQLSLREKERDLERLSHLLTHNQDTINSFDSLIKEKEVELQQRANTLKDLRRSREEAEDNLSRALREKDAIIGQLQRSLEGKTRDMEEMAGVMLSQSQSQARDLAEQMGQRLKVTEAMLAEAVKARERLVADNESAVEGLLATINSKDQLLKESAERYNRTLSERAHEIQEVKRQLSETQQQLASAHKHSSTATQEGRLETAELRASVAEKDSIINKLLERGQERDQYLASLRLKEGPGSDPAPGSAPQVLELTHTIQLLQERLDHKEAELSMRNNNEEHTEKVPQYKKNVVLLKKELAQKTEALNKALKRENQLKMSLAELQAALSELEGRVEGQTANIESLSSTLETKDHIIHDLHQHLSQRGSSQTDSTQEKSSRAGVEQSLLDLPQRERTIIGGDSQQEALPSLATLQVEHVALNRALRTEQQLYSSLVRTVKEQDSAQRLHALQLELTAVTLLRQQLEEAIRSNQVLQDQLETELLRSRAREGVDHGDPKELESVRHQLEDAQRWNASLQSRLGAIQNRGGGVGGADDTADTLSFIADQTSYMSICVGGGLEEEGLAKLSAAQLRDKVLELQELVTKLQALNGDLQRRLTIQMESPDGEAASRDTDSQNPASSSPGKQPWPRKRKVTPPAGRDAASQTDGSTAGRAVDGRVAPSDPGARHQAPAEPSDPGSASQESGLGDMEERTDALLWSLLADCGVASASQLREEVRRLRWENGELRGLLKEQNSTESKESADSSGEGSEGVADLRTAVQRLRAEAKGHSQVIRFSKERLGRAAGSSGPAGVAVATEREGSEVDGEEEEEEEGGEEARRRDGRSVYGGGHPSRGHSHGLRQQSARHGSDSRSRIPVPIRTRIGSTARSSCSRKSVNHQSGDGSDPLQHLGLDHVFGPDQHSTPESALPQSTKPGNIFSAGSVESLENQNQDLNQNLLTQLDLLHQESQEKEALIGRLEEQIAEWEDLQEQLRQKELLNQQYQEALKAAESTISYLTACSLDTQAGLGGPGSGLGHVGSGLSGGGGGSDGALQRRCLELQQALLDKEKLNSQLVECLRMAEAAVSSLDAASPSDDLPPRLRGNRGGVRGDPDPRALCERLEAALLRRAGASSPERHDAGPQRRADGLREAPWVQIGLDAQLQEEPEATEGRRSQGSTVPPAGPEQSHGVRQAGGERRRHGDSSDTARSNGSGSGRSHGEAVQQQQQECLSECLRAAESAVASLAAHCTPPGTSSSPGSPRSGADLQRHLDRLHGALLEREALGGPDHTTPPSLQTTRSSGYKSQKPLRTGAETVPSSSLGLHANLCLLQGVFSELQAALEAERSRAQPRELDAGASSQENQAQLESLQQALKEKRRTCKVLEEKLSRSGNAVAPQDAGKKAVPHRAPLKAPPMEQEDKGVQVDLGYETNGKSEAEVDREEEEEEEEVEEEEEESGSTDLGRLGLQLVGSDSCSLPSLLLKQNQDQNTFSSMDNLDSGSSISYPSSPALSSPKVSLGSLQAFEDYGATDDPSQLQAQVQELRAQLESQTRVALRLQNLLLRKNSLSSDPVTPVASRPAAGAGDPEGGDRRESHAPDRSARGGGEEEEEEKRGMKEKISRLNGDLERERSVNRSVNERLQQTQYGSRSASPARLDSLVQSQARELSQLRRQITDSRGLGALQRRQLEELSAAFQELLRACHVDRGLGEACRERLDTSLHVLERLEGRLEKGDGHPDNEGGAALELAQSPHQYLVDPESDTVSPPHSSASQNPRYLRRPLEGDGAPTQKPPRLQEELGYLRSLEEDRESAGSAATEVSEELQYLRLQLEGERELLRQHLGFLARRYQSLAESAGQQLDLLSKELQEKTQLVEALQNQLRGQSPSSHHSCSQSDLSERANASQLDSPARGSRAVLHGTTEPAGKDPQPRGGGGASGLGGVFEGGATEAEGGAARLQGLERENGRLQEKLRGSQELNATLRSELDLHRSLLVQTGSPNRHQNLDQGVWEHDGSAPLRAEDRRSPGQQGSAAQYGTMDPELLAEHLHEIRALRRRLEETIHTNDRLREQLENRLAEVERDPAATNIFIQGSDEQGQLTSELRFLWEQNHALKEQLSQGSRDKQKENEKLREALARRTARLEQSSKEVQLLREENSRLEERAQRSTEENTGLQEALSCSREALLRLQCEGKHQRQQLSDNQHLLQSLRVELQVYEQIQASAHTHTESGETAQQHGSGPVPGSGSQSGPAPGSGSRSGSGSGSGSVPLDLSELLSEIRHLRLQLERSIQTNTALRQRLEEQLLRGTQRPDTININYLLPTSDEGGRSPDGEGSDPLYHSSHSHTDTSRVYHERRRRAVQADEADAVPQCPSPGSGDSLSAAPPSRLVPGHRLWAHGAGRHVLGLIEDHHALRKQITEGRRLTRSMDARLQECLLGSDGRAVEQHALQSLCSSVHTMQQVLEEAGRLLKLLWRVSLPSSEGPAGGMGSSQQEGVWQSEVARLRSRLSQQEKMLSGAIRRLRTTNHLKEGMERVIVDQLSLTHGVLKKARGNLEEVPVSGQ